MRNRRLLWGAVILFVVCLAACKKEKPQSPIPDSLASLQELFNPAYQIDADSIRLMFLFERKPYNSLGFGFVGPLSGKR